MESEPSPGVGSTRPGSRSRTGGQGPDPEQEAKARRQAQLEQRHLEAYWNMHRLRDALCRRYASLLQDKVLSQRSQLQQRRDAARAKSPDTHHKKVKKLTFSKLQHNDSYLRPLPKSCFYLIFDLQRQLAERGRLQTHHQLEDFYSSIEFRVLEGRPAAGSMTSEERPCTAEETRREENFSDFRSSHREPGSREGNQEEEPMFPEVGVKTTGAGTTQIIPEIPRKSRKAEIYSTRLRRMHALCLSNMAFSQRLLDGEADSLSWQEERGGDPTLPGKGSKHGKTNQTNVPRLRTTKQTGSVQKSRPASPKQPSRKTSLSGHKRSESPVCVTAARCPKPPDPLSIEDLRRQKSVEIPERGVTLWRNYVDD